jgi:outer membrane receptor for ferrienterochelin and colicin
MAKKRRADHRTGLTPLLLFGLASLLPSRVCLSAAVEPDEDDQLAQIVVSTTRTPTLIKDEPVHVEVVPTEEIEENLTEAPGNLSSLFGELPGVHWESSAPALGGGAMQLPGMPARHTLVLMDGLPQLTAEPDAFGIMQIAPVDLARVEVIKGALRALWLVGPWRRPQPRLAYSGLGVFRFRQCDLARRT